MKHSAHDTVVELIKQVYGQFKLAEPEDHESIHRLLEAEGMVLSDSTVLRYSRRPDLVASFVEAGWNPLIFIARESSTFLAVIGESELYWSGDKRHVYYVSDLRTSRNTTKEVRAGYRKCFTDIMKAIGPDRVSLASILKKNERAIQALTNPKDDVHLHEVCPYLIRSILLLPSLRLCRRRRMNGLSIASLSERPELASKLERFVSTEARGYQFTVDPLQVIARRGDPANEYAILRGSDVVGHVSLFRPRSRRIFVDSKSANIRFWIWLQSRLYGHDYGAKVPWVYLSSLMVRDEILEEPELLPWLVRDLFDRGSIGPGELLMIAHPRGEEQPSAFHYSEKGFFFLNCPQFNSPASLYQVTDKVDYERPAGKVHLDPSIL